MDGMRWSRNFACEAISGWTAIARLEFFQRYGEDFGVDLTRTQGRLAVLFLARTRRDKPGNKARLVAGISAWLLQAILFPHLSTFFGLVTAAGFMP